MKKKFSLIFVSVLAMFLVACGNSSNSGATSYDNSNSSSEAETTPTVTSEPTFTPTPTLTPTPTPTPDPLAMLEVTEEWALENEGTYLKRNGKIYSLGIIPENKVEAYNIGYWLDNSPVFLYYEHRNGVASAGDVPVVTFMDGDELITVGTKQIDFYPVVFRGYSFRYTDLHPMTWSKAYFAIFDTPHSFIEFLRRNFDSESFQENFKVCAHGSEDPVDDYSNLKHGEEYTISWFDVTDYHEISQIADSARYDKNLDTNIGLECFFGELNKGGYAEYDLAEIRKKMVPGIYRMRGGYLASMIVEFK